ncbi:ABC-type transport auxiliary lipoprotein family protein [Puniceibacterium sp. IMCC21224]|uniref:ABC-type transport auxiliary lipoprotein family protein n=1 Tax=Puniceibacterium sp. IMCC21224 TaxID=1618204 RepID=UPI00064D8997|nr:ABC-type transport auxiliary lipoprotein family protein [Puniceibacterium sp. IMCC21224]KMK65632.1 ABC-type uncharacterized transport system, auxiliary component [Puniceibacterium sp. IMCC21224]
MIRFSPSKLVPLIAVLALSGCSALSALSDASQPLDVFDLRAPTDVRQATRALPLSLTVELPTTGGALQTDRILIRPSPLQAQYLPDVRWSETTPVFVQTLMLRSLEDTGAFRYIARTPLGGTSDIAILTEITNFEAETAGEDMPVTIRLRISSSLVRERDARITASRSFTATAQATDTDAQSVVEAFDRASQSLLSEFAAWTASSLGARLR